MPRSSKYEQNLQDREIPDQTAVRRGFSIDVSLDGFPQMFNLDLELKRDICFASTKD
jgi:hypothetical protein